MVYCVYGTDVRVEWYTVFMALMLQKNGTLCLCHCLSQQNGMLCSRTFYCVYGTDVTLEWHAVFVTLMLQQNGVLCSV
jgi:hypothetical protein